MLDINLGLGSWFLGLGKIRSGTDFNNLAFENFQGFLNQRIVFKIVFVEGNGGRFRLCGRHGRRSRFGLLEFTLKRVSRTIPHIAGLNSNALVLLRGYRRCFDFDEFNLRIGMAKLREFGLEQRVVARVVHESEMICKFGFEANREQILVEGNRICVHEITPRKRTDAANGFNQPGPQPGQVGVADDVSRRIYCRRLSI